MIPLRSKDAILKVTNIFSQLCNLALLARFCLMSLIKRFSYYCKIYSALIPKSVFQKMHKDGGEINQSKKNSYETLSKEVNQPLFTITKPSLEEDGKRSKFNNVQVRNDVELVNENHKHSAFKVQEVTKINSEANLAKETLINSRIGNCHEYFLTN